MSLLGRLQVEMVRPVQKNVAGEYRGEMFKIAIQHGIPISAQMIKPCLHIACIPHGYHVEQQAETGGTIQLAGKIPSVNIPSCS